MFDAAHDASSNVDYPYSPRGDGNGKSALERPLRTSQLITLIPREGTETRYRLLTFSGRLNLLITLIPREGTETRLIVLDINKIRMPVDYPYSPRGDGNVDEVTPVARGYRR